MATQAKWRLGRADKMRQMTPIHFLDTHELKCVVEQDGFNLAEAKAGNLSPLQVSEAAARLLPINEPEAMLGLTGTCHKRARRNTLFLLVFLKVLQAEEKLRCKLSELKWERGKQRALPATAAASNVAGRLCETKDRKASHLCWSVTADCSLFGLLL